MHTSSLSISTVISMSLEVPAHSHHAGKPASRIRQKNEQAILQAAEDEFARHGYKGTSMNTIAASAGLPKANLHYYFTNKLGLYIAVLSNILELWDSTFNTLTAEDDPTEALTRSIKPERPWVPLFQASIPSSSASL